MKKSTAPSISPRPIRCPTANSWPRCAKPGTCPTACLRRRRSSPSALPPAHRARAGPQEPPRRSRPPASMRDFEFEFPDWPEAAADLVRQWRARDDLWSRRHPDSRKHPLRYGALKFGATEQPRCRPGRLNTWPGRAPPPPACPRSARRYQLSNYRPSRRTRQTAG